jgi:C1A family cysteine protease
MMNKEDILVLLKSNRFRYWVLTALSVILSYLVGKRLIKYYGAKPSKKDRRDYRLAKLSPKFPDKFELPLPVIKDQSNVGSCVAHSISYLAESLLPKKDEYEKDRVSVGFTYGYRPRGYYRGEGMYPREAFKTFQQRGVVRHVDFPFNVEVPKITEMVDAELARLLSRAKDNRISKYFQLKTEEEIKSCLMNYGPVSVMYPVHDEFSVPVNGKIDVRGLKGFQGYHQVSIYGWDNGYWLVANSWDESWGNRGTALISKKYPWVEMWGATDKDTDVVPPKPSFFLRRGRG